jgi:hypothetical protein
MPTCHGDDTPPAQQLTAVLGLWSAWFGGGRPVLDPRLKDDENHTRRALGGSMCGPLRRAGSLRRLLGGDAECFGMSTAVVLGQDLTKAARPVRDGAVADLATGDRQLGNGHREAAGR